jgi:stage V sporulation protein D (sporulation-specific penicillin-binding protein)
MPDGETYTCTGSRGIGRRNVRCALHAGRRDHGELGLDQMIVQSCNTGMATVALELGADRMDAWARRFGFGRPTGIELPGESRGILPPSGKWSQMRVANVGFGQGISVTPLQLLAAYCAVANGGYLVHPHVVQAVIDPTGRVDEVVPSKPTQVISSATAARLRDALELAVREGTGNNAQIAGRRVAGKTGTAQKPVPGLGFSAGKYVASFAGFAPAEHPRLAVVVVVDEPQGSHYGGVVAAPAFREICERALTVLRVPPDAPAPPPRLTVARAGHAT